MTTRTIVLMACATLFTASHSLSAQDTTSARVTWAPERPVQGTLFLVRAAPAVDDARVTGRLAGEPLHFARTDSGWEAVAAAPLDQGSQLELTIAVARSGSADTVRATVPIAKGTYALEKLTVAPRFGAE